MPRTVYVVQKQYKFDRDSQEYVAKFDLSAAEGFGQFKYLLSPNATPWRMHEVIPELHAGLSDYTEDDYLLLIGNPILIGCASAIAADYSGGAVRFLQWSGRDRAYIPVYAEIFSQDENV